MRGVDYDVAIAGGGLAGLSLSILLARAGHRVVLFEKESYPFHRVCGEYVSLESWSFLERLGVPLGAWDLPIVRRLSISAPDGKLAERELPLGGFGISRYRLDACLASLARRSGVELWEDTRVQEVSFREGRAVLGTSRGEARARVACGAHGKRSHLDVRWRRDFVLSRSSRLDNLVGVKYHLRTDGAADTVTLHNFEGGYCGLSRVEDGRSCLCYLTTAANLRRSGNDIERMESEVLRANPWLDRIFSSAEPLFEAPVTIAQISFARKSQVEEHALLLGDAAGMIPPLCGNGMSMALHGGKLAFTVLHSFLTGEATRASMEARYRKEWNRAFAARLRTGRLLQRFFGKKWPTYLLLAGLAPFPRLASALIRRTHGESF